MNEYFKIEDTLKLMRESAKFERQRILKLIDEEVHKWAVELGIYEQPEKINIIDSLDLVKQLKDAINKNGSKE